MPRFTNRLTGTSTSTLPGCALSGELVTAQPVVVDGVPSPPGVLLVDTEDSLVSVGSSAGTARARILQGQTLETLAAVRNVPIRGERGTWERVDRSVPVVSRKHVEDTLAVTWLEDVLTQHMANLEEVFFSPWVELRPERVRQPVHRARRLSPRAGQVLASRSEDWLRITPSGVVPRVIEGLLQEDLVDVYENRVAARLLDILGMELERLRRRIARVADVVTHGLDGWHRQLERKANLWGAQAAADDRDDDDLARRSADRASALDTWLWRVQRLRSGPLYRGVPVRAQIDHPIRTTNLLADDPHYRAVRMVWEEWWHNRADIETPAERRSRAQDQASKFAELCWLALARGLSDLAAPQGRTELAGRHAVETPWGRIELAGVDDPPVEGVWSISLRPTMGPARDLRAVALPTELLSGSDSAVAERLHHLHRTLADGDARDAALVLYPGAVADVETLPPDLRDLAHHIPLPGQGSRSWVVPISPLDLESLERISRVLHWELLEAHYLGYPATIAMPPSVVSALIDAPWLAATDGQGSRPSCVAILAPTPRNRLDDTCRRLGDEADRFERQLGGRGGFDASRIRAVLPDLRKAWAATASLATCPVCASSGARFEARPPDTFRCSCPCGAEWGLRRDADSDNRIPYLAPEPVAPPLPPPGSSPPLPAQRRYGRDILAPPCELPAADLRRQMVNPYTGRCTSPLRDAEACSRCSADMQTQALRHPLMPGGSPSSPKGAS